MLRQFHVFALIAFSLSLCGCGGGDGERPAAVVVSAPEPVAVPTADATSGALEPMAPSSGPLITATSATEVEQLLRNARGGEIIHLMPGRYDPISFRGLRFDVPITITSADAKIRAELTGANLRDSKGIRLTNLRLVDHSPESQSDFLVHDSQDIAFDNIQISSMEGAVAYQSGPLMIRSSKNVRVTRSEITHVRYGISLLDNQGLSIVGNYFHDIRTDGVRGGGNSDVEIVDNLFTNFSPSDGDHPDAIQFWTTNTTSSASNITIANNVIARGDGSAMQGIFMRDEVTTLAYQRVTIERNVVTGTSYHGIFVGNASTLNLSDNRVTGMADQKSWISVPAAATLTNNAAQLFIVGGINSSALSGNTLIPASTDNGTALGLAWLAEHER